MDNIVLRLDDSLELRVRGIRFADSKSMLVEFGLSSKDTGGSPVIISVVAPMQRVGDSGIPDYTAILNLAIGRLKGELEKMAELMEVPSSDR